jgi:hypothetical protein
VKLSRSTLAAAGFCGLLWARQKRFERGAVQREHRLISEVIGFADGMNDSYERLIKELEKALKRGAGA